MERGDTTTVKDTHKYYEGVEFQAKLHLTQGNVHYYLGENIYALFIGGKRTRIHTHYLHIH